MIGSIPFEFFGAFVAFFTALRKIYSGPTSKVKITRTSTTYGMPYVSDFCL
jgi:hypothetical protein